MAANLSPLYNDKTMTATGAPASGYRIYTYVGGSSTPLATYTDAAGTTPQANPIVLNSSGFPNSPVWLAAGSTYKFIEKDANDVVIRTIDGIKGINDTTATANQFQGSGVTPTYVSASSFTLAGDQTSEFHVGRRLQLSTTAGTVYGTIATSAFTSLTTVTLTMDAGNVLDSGLSGVNLSILRADKSALPTAAYNVTSLNASASVTTAALTAASLNGSAFAGLRNRFINGGILVDQRNNGVAQTFIAGAALAYCVDQFYGYCTGANITGQQVTVNGQKRYRFSGGAANTAVGFGQRIEAANSADMAGSTASFQVKLSSSSLTAITWTAYYANTTDTFGTLAIPTRTQIATGTFAIGSTEATYGTQIAVPAAATTGVEIVLSGGALLAGQTLTIGDLQFEPGSVVTPFERRPYGLEDLLCKRYYEALDFSGSVTSYFYAGTQNNALIPFIQKRAIPTIAVTYSVNTATTQLTSVRNVMLQNGTTNFAYSKVIADAVL